MVDGKVLAFTRPQGAVLKLRQEKIATLTEMRDAEFLLMGKRVMREWVLLRYAAADDFVQERELFREAMGFVRSLPGVAAR